MDRGRLSAGVGVMPELVEGKAYRMGDMVVVDSPWPWPVRFAAWVCRVDLPPRSVAMEIVNVTAAVDATTARWRNVTGMPGTDRRVPHN